MNATISKRVQDRSDRQTLGQTINVTREESFNNLKQKCMNQVKHKRAQILKALRQRRSTQNEENDKNGAPADNFVSSSIRQLVRREVRSQVTGKRGRDYDNEDCDQVVVRFEETDDLKRQRKNGGTSSSSSSSSSGKCESMEMMEGGEGTGDTGDMAGLGDRGDMASKDTERMKHGDTMDRYNTDSEDEINGMEEFTDSDIEFMLQLEEEILSALKDEENEILLEYYESMHERELVQDMEDESHEQMYANHLNHLKGDESKMVLCPMCEYSYLLQNRSVLFCDCGFRMDSKSDSIGLRHVKIALGNIMVKHTQSGCNGSLRFETTEMFGSGVHLMAKCEACNTFDIVV
jgi:hypothetical protein